MSCCWYNQYLHTNKILIDNLSNSMECFCWFGQIWWGLNMKHVTKYSKRMCWIVSLHINVARYHNLRKMATNTIPYLMEIYCFAMYYGISKSQCNVKNVKWRINIYCFSQLIYRSANHHVLIKQDLNMDSFFQHKLFIFAVVSKNYININLLSAHLAI